MSQHHFSSEEAQMLSALAHRLEDNTSGMDSDTSHLVQKLETASGELTLTDLERLSLQSILQTAVEVAKVTPNPELDPAVLEILLQKLTH